MIILFPASKASPSVITKQMTIMMVNRLIASSPSISSPPPSSNSWLDSSTCGWYADSSSKAYTCGSLLSCATNTDHAVACTTSGLARFYTICLNYEAVQSSKCTSAGPKTACCTKSNAPACGTFLWAATEGATITRSMIACFPTPTIIPMLDEPSFASIVTISDSGTSARTSPTRSPATLPSTTSSTSAPTSSATQPVEGMPTSTWMEIGISIGAAAILLMLGGWVYYKVRVSRRVKKDKRGPKRHAPRHPRQHAPRHQHAPKRKSAPKH